MAMVVRRNGWMDLRVILEADRIEWKIECGR